VPDDRFFSGLRDVSFTLANSAGTRYANGSARYVVAKLTISGGR